MKPKKVIWLAILTASLAAAAVVIVALVQLKLHPPFGPYDYARHTASEKELREYIGSRVGCTLPEQARDLHAVNDGGRDPTHWISFRVDPAQLPPLLSEISGPWTDRLEAPLPRAVPDFVKDWWNPPSSNISVHWDCEPAKRAMDGRLWIIDLSRGVVYYCQYSS